MTPVKKIEVVADALHLADILRVLDQQGVSGYTVVRDVTGRGDRGVRRGDELTGVFNNVYVMTACPPDRVTAIVEGLRPLLARFGGIALVTDAMWVLH